ncbi:MAG: hypothetical protein ACREFD_09265 [Stellaceae bacterium]
MKIPAWIKPAFWGLVVGALGWWAVLAWGLGWTSAGSATAMAQQNAETAVVASVTPYCVQRFEQQTNAAAVWKKLKNSAANFNQDSFLVKGGWTALPGMKLNSSYADAVADSCSTRLLALKTIGGVKVSSAD